MSSPSVLTVIATKCTRIGGMERYARELSIQLGHHGWSSLLCFLSLPEGEVRDFLTLPNVTLIATPGLAVQGWPAVSQLWQAIRSHRPKIVHLQFTPFLSPLPWVSWLGGARKVFFTDHGSNPEGSQPRPAPQWKQTVARLISAPYEKVISVSEFNRRIVAAHGFVAADRTCCIHNGTDVTRTADPATAAAFRSRFGIPADRILVVQVSWIIPEKGIHDLLHAAAVAVQSNPRLHFAIVGEGKHRPRYTQLAQELGIDGHITWTGLISDPFSAGVFAAADIMCQLSRWEEAFGLVIVEGMAFAKPVVATRVGGIPELVRDGENGFLVPRGDTHAMAARFLQLAADSQLRAQLGDTGRAFTARFDVQDKVRQLLQLYGIE